ncbi:hypothetical protein SAMN04489761_3444 [Tenacibaculum sp. MAR_2009_124]|uniref:hypothetical protein n=1 Tax=Tenacibaculum sp. MAR_2009_124 TaxID=1250059 RepID=UPI000895B3DF|nr:hypothetical protein [Tenacibaculum sp. MAR_2009_124]SEC66616.1 hypothetical protein SAMN04489761_3444 [Tenacibaculum sp. MAR_2009_124]
MVNIKNLVWPLVFGLALMLAFSFFHNYFEKKDHTYENIKMVTLFSKDTITLQDVKEETNCYVLKDSSKIFKNKIVWIKKGKKLKSK